MDITVRSFYSNIMVFIDGYCFELHSDYCIDFDYNTNFDMLISDIEERLHKELKDYERDDIERAVSSWIALNSIDMDGKFKQYIGILSDGTELPPTDFWDWCGMNVCINEYVKQGYDDDTAYKKFWEDVKNFDPEEYGYLVDTYGSIEYALGHDNGQTDDLRLEYLHSIKFNYKEIWIEG